jgi:hypothetical protein
MATTGRRSTGGAAAQFDGRVDDIYFIHDSDEPDGGEEQNECELDDVHDDEPDGVEMPNASDFAYGDDEDGAEEQNECGFEFGGAETGEEELDVLRL